MDFEVLKTEKKFCICCMEEHEVSTVRVKTYSTFKNKKVDYCTINYYCDISDELFMDESQMRENNIVMKNVYRDCAEGCDTV